MPPTKLTLGYLDRLHPDVSSKRKAGKIFHSLSRQLQDGESLSAKPRLSMRYIRTTKEGHQMNGEKRQILELLGLRDKDALPPQTSDQWYSTVEDLLCEQPSNAEARNIRDALSAEYRQLMVDRDPMEQALDLTERLDEEYPPL